METTNAHAISSLKSLLFLGRTEEKRLRAVLAGHPDFRLRMQTRFELEMLLRKTTVQSEELEKLLAGGA